MPFWMILPYFLGAMLFAATAMRDLRSFGMIALLLLDWAGCTWLAQSTGSQNEWIWLSLIDGWAAAIFLIPRRRFEAALSISLILEIILHLAYGYHEVFHISAQRADIYHWWLTFAVAWGQAIAIMARGIWNGGSRYLAHRDLRRADHIRDRLVTDSDLRILRAARGRGR